MPPKSKRAQQCQNAINSRWKKHEDMMISPYQEPHRISSQQAVIGCLVSGTTYTSFSRGLAVANITCGCKTAFYNEQKKLYEIVEKESQRTMDEAIAEEVQENPNGATVSFDARYSSRRKAVQCTTSFIGKNEKVLHVEHAIDAQPHREGNFNGSSTNMESFTVVNGMNALTQKMNIIEYVHDGYNKSPARLKEAGFNLT